MRNYPELAKKYTPSDWRKIGACDAVRGGGYDPPGNMGPEALAAYKRGYSNPPL
jgi:hypothetical protein